ncbi:uncharacterized protein LOC114257513 [Camellia sinensis]|uniref:uncharacterized protein LOC114257513 n=1 Tax=Camellia sinensis TaxID=4442 RepID=UPI001036890B|nr:uncharacterized protein LOC114257513 [Camellia sinensis]
MSDCKTTREVFAWIQESQNQEHYISCFDGKTYSDDEYVELFQSPFHNSEKSLDIVGSCNGLVVLNGIFFMPIQFNLLLWNPSICSRDSGALCYVSTHSWRSICVADFCHDTFYRAPFVFVNGAVHWIAFVRNLAILMVVVFDMGDEVFRDMAMPNHLLNLIPTARMQAMVLGDSLAIIDSEQNINHKTFHIWVVEECGVVESWAKQFTIILEEEFLRVAGFRKNIW